MKLYITLLVSRILLRIKTSRRWEQKSASSLNDDQQWRAVLKRNHQSVTRIRVHISCHINSLLHLYIYRRRVHTLNLDEDFLKASPFGILIFPALSIRRKLGLSMNHFKRLGEPVYSSFKWNFCQRNINTLKNYLNISCLFMAFTGKLKLHKCIERTWHAKMYKLLKI